LASIQKLHRSAAEVGMSLRRDSVLGPSGPEQIEALQVMQTARPEYGGVVGPSSLSKFIKVVNSQRLEQPGG